MTWRRIWGLTYGEAHWLVPTAILLVYELIVVIFRPAGWDVLTRAYRANVTRWTIWPVALGVLCGHLNGPGFQTPRWSAAIFIVVLAGELARDVFVRDPVPQIAIFGLFLLSVMVGAASWVGAP